MNDYTQTPKYKQKKVIARDFACKQYKEQQRKRAMAKISHENEDKLRRIKLNMNSIKKAEVNELYQYTPMIIDTMEMVVEILDELVEAGHN